MPTLWQQSEKKWGGKIIKNERCMGYAAKNQKDIQLDTK